MKILFVSTLYYPFNIGGAEATVRLLARAARDAGDEPVILSLAPKRDDVSEREIDGIRVIYVALHNIYFPTESKHRSTLARLVWHAVDAFNPLMARTVGRILDAEKPDVVSLHNIQGFSSSVWWATSRRAIPMVQTLHDYYTGCLNSTMYRTGRNCSGLCIECKVLGAPRHRLSRRVNGVTAVSRRQFDRLEAVGVFQGVQDRRVIHGCNEVASAPRDGMPAREQGPLRLGFLGRLDPIKGLDWALRVISTFGADEIVVSVAGRGDADYEDALRRDFGPPQVRFEGYVQPEDWFGSIDLLLVPSLWEEPFARVMHEALDRGVPLLGAAVGGMPELIETGKTGFLFHAGDEESLRSALRYLIDTPPDWTALSLACREASGAYLLSKIFADYRQAWDDARTRRSVEA